MPTQFGPYDTSSFKMDGDEAPNLVLKQNRPITEETQGHREIRSKNDGTKIWPSHTTRVRRSASIRFE